MRWFTADLHLGHKNIIDYCDRPFRTLDGQLDTSAMKRQLTKNFRSVIRPGDELYILGDLSFDADEAVNFLNWIPGQKFMVWGNHDPKRKERRALEKCFVKTGDILETKIGPDSTPVVMCHYPMLQWNKGHFGSVMLHGHTHGECRYPDPNLRILDVGVDSQVLNRSGHAKFYPWSEAEILGLMAGRELVKHHDRREI